jgi:hypothetical protein
MKHISTADVEFYEGLLVMRVARNLLPDNKAWEDLTHRSKQFYLNKAVKVVYSLLNNVECMQRLQFLTSQFLKDVA